MDAWIRVCSSCYCVIICPKVKPAFYLYLWFIPSLSLAQMVKLQACIKYCEEDYSAAKVTSSLALSVNAYKLYSFHSVRWQFESLLSAAKYAHPLIFYQLH